MIFNFKYGKICYSCCYRQPLLSLQEPFRSTVYLTQENETLYVMSVPNPLPISAVYVNTCIPIIPVSKCLRVKCVLKHFLPWDN